MTLVVCFLSFHYVLVYLLNFYYVLVYLLNYEFVDVWFLSQLYLKLGPGFNSILVPPLSQLKDYVTLRLLQMNPTKMSPRANQITIREFIPGKEPKQH